MPSSNDVPAVSGIESECSTLRYGDIEVCWRIELEGGGRSFGQSFRPVIEHLFGRVDRVFEACAGAGCIGFSLLAHGLCDSLVLSDVNPVAVATARETVRRNGLEDRVNVYQSDGLEDMPEHERCDLFVVNPPFFVEEDVPFLRDPWVVPGTELRAHDPELGVHRKLYAEIPRFLNAGGSVLFQETSLGTDPQMFLPMIERSGLQHIRTIWYTENQRFFGLYFLWSKLASPTMLMGEDDPQRVDVELREPPAEPLEIPSEAVYLLRLHNLTGRPVSAKVDLTGNDDPELERTLVEIPPDEVLDTPPTTLGAAKSFTFRDERSGSVLAKVVAAPRPRSGRAAPFI